MLLCGRSPLKFKLKALTFLTYLRIYVTASTYLAFSFGKLRITWFGTKQKRSYLNTHML